MTTIPKHPMELAKGDVIHCHPETGGLGTWTVLGPSVQYGEVAEIEYRDGDRIRGRFSVSVHTELTIERTPRQELISGLRALAQFLEGNPGVPVGEVVATDFNYFPASDCLADPFGEVDRIAALIGEKPRAGVHYMAVKEFGPVSYRAVVCKHKPVMVQKAAGR